MKPKLRGRCKLVLLTLILLALMISSNSTVQSVGLYRVYLPILFLPKVPLPNSSFELGTTNWILYPESEPLIYDQSDLPSGIVPHTGRHVAWLGYHLAPDSSAENSISQQIVIPAVAPNLSFWTQFRSNQPCGTTQSRLAVSVNDDEPEWSLEPCKERSVNSWARQIIDLSRYSNQKVILTLQVTLEPGDTARVFLDDVEFVIH